MYAYMEGGNLDEFLRSAALRRRYGLRRRVMWMYHVASGLAFLHTNFQQPIRHWDIKPSNVLLDTDRRVAKVADMGLAKFYSDEQRSSTRHGPRGSMSYLDPKYLQSHRYTPASDVYSYGLVLLQVVAGEQSPSRATERADNVMQGTFDSFVDPDMPGPKPTAVVQQLVELG